MKKLTSILLLISTLFSTQIFAQENIEEETETISESATKAFEETLGSTTEGILDFVKSFCTWSNLFKVIGAVLMILIIWIVFKLIKKIVKKSTKEKVTKHVSALINRGINYIFYFILITYILNLFGINLTALWGAAGIAGVAIGFAAQTSVSNLISGLFVLSEKTMKIGDFISVGGVSGIVDSIELLSIKIHTLDNQMIRIPNSEIINSNFQNNNYFETRRMNFSVSVAYETDLQKAMEELKKVPGKCPTILQDPAPNVWFEGLGASGINMILSVWFKTSDLVQTKNDVFMNIVETFNNAKIEIPYNKIDINVFNK